MEATQRPITILIAALGGEGGGVLADWIIAAAAAEDYPVQSTSIPGVAQRTGATTYYIELYPLRATQLGGRRPVMTLAPAPADIDVMLASELLEAGRALANGFVTPERTTLIASTHRIYTVEEKIALGDGRYDSERILAAAGVLAKRAILTDFHKLAANTGAMINAALFGALAGSGTLPLPRAACENAIRSAGKGAEASLRGFALGYAAAEGKTAAGAPATPPVQGGTPARSPYAQARSTEAQARSTEALALPRDAQARSLAERLRQTFPAAVHEVLEQGVARVVDFQGVDYAALYLDRLEPIAKLDREQGAAGNWKLTGETARFLALWMSYEDVIRVADLKSRRSRFERVRGEVQAKPGEPVRIIEYLKPGVEEAAALLPPALSRRLVAWAEKRGLMHKLNVGLHVNSSSVTGFLMLRLLAWLRPLRRRSARYAEEQALIARWLAAITAAPAPELALEIALCGRLIKGYGDTNRRAKANFLRIFDTLVDGGALPDSKARAEAIRAAREGALADPEGRGLEATLATHGIAPLPPQPKIIQFMRRPGAKRKTT
ncbi:MAG TPA: indolepyruvate oxidoreductase subunit beta family protein [Burkholderiales bacterium]|nr:indolepyruvate oxidoreductase subunit beta family protein [Burkholderiales bacterium]